MTLETATKMPDSINAGDTFKVKLSYSDFLASAGWSLLLVIINASDKQQLASTADGDAHELSAPAATTADWLDGLYKYKIFATDGTDRHQVAFGQFEVLPDLTVVKNYDHRTHVKKVVDALEALILGKASQDQQSLTIEGKSLSRYTPEELIKWKSHYDQLLITENNATRIANGGSRTNVIRTRFK